jgi:hypothetical protein
MRSKLICLLLLVFGLIGFAQDPPAGRDPAPRDKFKIEDFVLARILPSKTVIFVGDRFELRLEIIYLKDVGIQILTEELEKDSLAAFLPDSMVLEKAEISQPVPWNEYWSKIEAVYTLFYPEKKHNTGILFFPADSKPLKIRFKWIDEEDKNIQENVEIYEVNVRPGQFILGVRSMLTDTSTSPRDYKLFSGNFFLKYWGGLLGGLILIIFGLSIPIKMAISLVKNKLTQKKQLSIKARLKNDYRKLQVLRKISDLKEFSDSFCSALRSIIGIKTGLKTESMTVAEIKERMVIAPENSALADLFRLLEEYEDYRYNPETTPIQGTKEEDLNTAEKIAVNWIHPRHKKFKRLFKRWIN